MSRRAWILRRARRASASLLLAMLVGAAVPAADARTPVASAIERLEEAIDRHPDDPDLVYTFARKLAAVGRGSEAVVEMRGYLERWPDRRPQVRVEIARALIDGGRIEQAVVLLDEEVDRRPQSATARFYRGIAHRSAGRTEAANRDFAFAARLSPALRAESFLAQALGLFDLGREDEAVDLLRRILELDPTSESAIRARLMLRQREVVELERWWRLDAHAGFEWDDNVLLESAANESRSSDREDFRGVWGLGATARAITTERGALTLGYRFDQTVHDELDEFDLLTNSAFLSGSLQTSERTLFRLDVLGWNTRQDGDNELTAGLFRPNLIVSLGSEWGAIRGFLQAELFEYDDPPVLEAWERDGHSLGGGIEHFLPLPIPRSYLATSLSYQLNLTQAETGGGTSDFDGDNEYHSSRVRVRAQVALPAEVEALLDASYTNNRYHNNNFQYFFETLRMRKREDDIASARVTLKRALIDHVEVEIYWRGTWRMSNLPLFDYEKNVVGALIRVSTD